MATDRFPQIKMERQLLPPNVQVKQEVAAAQETNGGGGDAAMAVEGDTRKEMDIKLDPTLLHCAVCNDRLRPPVFQVWFPSMFTSNLID